jgi:hypothetical protein
MPDPAQQRIIIRESTGAKKEYPVFSAVGKSAHNQVLLKRHAFHEVHVCMKKDDAKKLLKRDFSGSLECIVRDTSRANDGGPDTEIRLYPLVPRRVEFLGIQDLQIVKIEFIVGTLNFADINNPPSTWSSVTDAESIYENQGITNQEQDENLLAEYHVAETIDPTLASGGDPFQVGEFRLHADVPASVRQAASIGFHQYTRNSHIPNRLRTLAAMTGTVIWADLDSYPGRWRMELAGEPQVNLQAALNVGTPAKRYIIKRYEDLEWTWTVPYLDRYGFRMRPDYISPFVQFPQNSIGNLGLTQPTFYQPTQSGSGGMMHFSSLVMPPIVIRTLAGLGLAAAQSMLDTQAATYERCVRAVERTIKGYFRASRRTERIEMAGYFSIPLGSEAAAVTYKQGRTFVDLRDESLPMWPRIPSASSPQWGAMLVQITDKTSTAGLYIGAYSAPHSGRWKAANYVNASGVYSQAINARPVLVEDKLGLFPWLDVGDFVLALHDGDRAVILQTTLSADVELI